MKQQRSPSSRAQSRAAVRAVRTRRHQIRLEVHRLVTRFSGRHCYAQIIAPDNKVVVSASTLEKPHRAQFAKNGANVAAAEFVGRRLAEKAKAQNLDFSRLGRLGFDRSGRQYAGRVRALAEAARAGGLKF